jgi:phosphohistidine phosphatase
MTGADSSSAVSIVLVHHAEAVGAEVDPQRPLSGHGLAQATSLASSAKAAGIVPTAIWHSGKLRARQTAESFWRVCNPLAEFSMVRGLRPDDPAEALSATIAAEERDLLLVSHMPLLPALLRILRPDAEAFPLHGLVWLRRTAEGRYLEQWRAAPSV